MTVFWGPTFEVFLHVLIKMSPIDMKQIDRAIFNIVKGFGKGLSQKRTKVFVLRVFCLNLFKDFLSVKPGMFITPPRIDSETFGF